MIRFIALLPYSAVTKFDFEFTKSLVTRYMGCSAKDRGYIMILKKLLFTVFKGKTIMQNKKLLKAFFNYLNLGENNADSCLYLFWSLWFRLFMVLKTKLSCSFLQYRCSEAYWEHCQISKMESYLELSILDVYQGSE